MEGFASGFYIISKKERKPINHYQLFFFYSILTFFLIIRDTCPIKTESIQESHQCNHPNTSREVQKADEVNFALGGLRIQSFGPDEHGAVNQSGTKPSERDQEVKEGQQEANQQSNLAEGIESRIMPQKENQAFFGTYHKIRISNLKISFRNRLKWIADLKKKRNCNEKQSKMSKEVIQL